MSTDRRRPAARGLACFRPRIEALIVYNSNPVAVAPESKRVVAGFAREDLFTVVLEHFLTDTADHADYVLPATTQLEHLDVHTTYGHTDVMFNEPAIAPLGESKPNTQIFRELAARMGFTEPCFADDDEALARQAFDWAALGTSFEALRENGWASLPLPEAPFANGGFATANGKAQVDVGGLGVAEHVPNYESALSSPELAKRFPLAMISPPARHFLNSSFVNVRSLRAIEGEPLLEIHADDAAPRGIESGGVVRIFNDRGEYRCKADVERTRAARRRQWPGHLVAQARCSRHQRQRAHAPAAHRHRPRAHVLRLPGASRGGGMRPRKRLRRLSPGGRGPRPRADLCRLGQADA